MTTNPFPAGWLARAAKIQHLELARRAVSSQGKPMLGEPDDFRKMRTDTQIQRLNRFNPHQQGNGKRLFPL
jgi:hypothetical protein